ncbi:hypothetical protein EV401DRAFT_1397622 [Pisolithus croceorrhizus]|nr:hypothetical protein EV401DRAFT_1397622 [Pisolithus croceorrhizus]
MSSLQPEIDSIVASALRQFREVQFAMVTLMLYDHAITLGKEYDFFWRGPLSLSKVLYLLIRYLTLALSVVLIMLTSGMIENMWVSHESP